MRKKIEFAVILVIIISIGYLLLAQATFKTEVSKKIPVTIYEDDEYSYDSAVIIDGTIINYLLSPRQRFSGTFKLEEFSDHTPAILLSGLRIMMCLCSQSLRLIGQGLTSGCS